MGGRVRCGFRPNVCQNLIVRVCRLLTLLFVVDGELQHIGEVELGLFRREIRRRLVTGCYGKVGQCKLAPDSNVRAEISRVIPGCLSIKMGLSILWGLYHGSRATER